MTNFPIFNTFILFCFYIYAIVLSLRVPTLWMSFAIVFLSQIFLIFFLIRKYGLKDLLKNNKQNIIFIIQFIASFIPVLNFFPWLIWFIYLDYKRTFSNLLEDRSEPLLMGGAAHEVSGVGLFDLEKIKEEIKADIQKELQKDLEEEKKIKAETQEKKVINQTLIEPINQIIEIKKTKTPVKIKIIKEKTTKSRMSKNNIHNEMFKLLNIKNKKLLNNIGNFNKI